MKSKFQIYQFLAFIMMSLSLFSVQNPSNNENFTENVKIALRDVGNKLLLAVHDSTSLVLPIKKLSEHRYELTFQNTLSISPDSLVSITNQSLKVANLPKRFIVEVLNCNNNEVFYSFKINNFEDRDIVPCLGRNLPNDCYIINILFLSKASIINSNTNYLLIGAITVIVLLSFFIIKNRKYKAINTSSEYTKIGNYKFYEDQNKLVKDAIEIKLSSKECELMNMFSVNQNQLIKREVITKEIWEDNGVFVGRSLDTFISKLRKKFKDDNSINIINVHGVGYKLEVN